MKRIFFTYIESLYKTVVAYHTITYICHYIFKINLASTKKVMYNMEKNDSK